MHHVGRTAMSTAARVRNVVVEHKCAKRKLFIKFERRKNKSLVIQFSTGWHMLGLIT